MPSTESEWEGIAEKFNELWQFPNCVGAVDGKHVQIVKPAHGGSVFYNYKGTHSIILMGVANAEYQLIYVDVGRNGRFSDGGVFNRCTFGRMLDSNQLRLPPPKALPGRDKPVPYVLVADDAFAMRQNLQKPYSIRGLSMLQRVFNYRLSRARRIIENVFGLMSARFRVLLNTINLDPEKTKKVTLASCVLHNFLLTTNKAKYAPTQSVDHYNADGQLVSGEWRNVMGNEGMFPTQNGTDYTPVDARGIREEFQNYFVSEGDLPWQYDRL